MEIATAKPNSGWSRPLLNALNQEDKEFQALLEIVYQQSGFDFRDYAPASRKRRIRKIIQDEALDGEAALTARLLRDPALMKRFIIGLTVDTSAMFRDPQFFQTFRREIAPRLRTYPFLRIWHAGCSSGEEVYSLAILLKEERLFEHTRIYATDINEEALEKARQGIYRMRAMRKYTENYIRAGGRRAFSEYYTAKYDHAVFQPALRKNVVWARHNLVTDASFNEFQVILCRNVVIYFNKSLQARVHRLFYDSLAMFGYLGLGNKETLRFTPLEDRYEVVDARWKWYRKVG